MTDAEVETTETDEIESTDEEVETQETVEPTEEQDSGLKKALAAERKARRDAEKQFKALQQQLADKEKPADEQALEAARREGREEGQGKANERIVRSELKAAATGKVRNPALALKLIDTSAIDVDEDGEVDADAVNDAIVALLEEYPELAVDAAKFQGSADQGTKGRKTAPPQITREQLRSMSPDQIMQARSEGRLDQVLGIKK